ncbi:MAG TPA: hypothetical protein VNZ52_07225 [Candidatus Thermoplasmatota archaeon]|nr:hypothetical protein [Candidatus Thermoplasmatota archaeon]
MSLAAAVPALAEGDLFDLSALDGWGIAGLGLAVTVLVLAISYGIALLWQKFREPKRT